MLLWRLLVTFLAIFIIVIGFITMISPVPFGIILLFFGLLLLVVANPHARPLLRWIRQRWPWFDARVDEIELRTPASIRDPLQETDPTPDHPANE